MTGVDRSVATGGENLTLIDGITKDSKRAKMETGKQTEWLIEHSDNFAIGYEISQSTAWVSALVLSMAAKMPSAEFAVESLCA